MTGEQFATADDYEVKVFDAGCALVYTIQTNHIDCIRSLASSADGRRILTVCGEGYNDDDALSDTAIRVWNPHARRARV